MNDYDRSVNRAIESVLAASTHRADDAAVERLRAGMGILCQRIARAVPTVEPCEVMAILDIALHLETAANQGGTMRGGLFYMVNRVLLRNGWSVPQTVQFYENFRNNNPEMFDVKLARLLTREQLHATYGGTYGDMLADILVEPRSQPLLYAMFYGNIIEPVPMVFRTAMIPVVFDQSLVTRPQSATSGFDTVAIPAAASYNMDGHYVPNDTARKLYKDSTGGSLAPFLSISLDDHGLRKTPEAEEALRQAHCS